MTAPVREFGPDAEHRRDLASALNLVLQGRINSTGELTIGSADTSTQVDSPFAYELSIPLLIPSNAAAAGITPYVSARAKGSFTLTHSAPGSDATFLYVLLG